MNADQFFYLSGIEKRAGKQVYKKFGINRHELNMLVGISAFLRLYNRKIISRKLFTDWLDVNYGLEKRLWAYIQGLINKGALHRLAYRRPDGNCLAISSYGMSILQAFDQALQAISKQDKILGTTYKDLTLDLDNIPQGYTLKQAGRN